MNRDDPLEFRLAVSVPLRGRMTEPEWLTADTPYQILSFIRESASPRKLRLFGVACCRRAAHQLEPQTIEALRIAEGYADGREKSSVLVAAGQEARRLSGSRFAVWLIPAGPSLAAQAVEAACQPGPLYDPVRVLDSLPDQPDPDRPGARPERFHQADLLREIIGNPFRPVAFDPAWRTDTAVSLARGMYGSRDFSAMPILADALQDAGCDSDDVFNHCRDEKQPHVRGCWVVDLVLGKV